MPAPRNLPSQTAQLKISDGMNIEGFQRSSVSGQRCVYVLQNRCRAVLTAYSFPVLSKGHVYDVYTSLACYLLTEGMAEPAPDDDPIAVLPIENQTFHRPIETRKGIILPRSLAADRARKNAERAPKKKKES